MTNAWWKNIYFLSNHIYDFFYDNEYDISDLRTVTACVVVFK